MNRSSNHYDLKVSAQKQNQAPSLFWNFDFIFRFAEGLAAIGLRRHSGLHRGAAAITKRAVSNKRMKCCAAAILLPA